MSNQPVADVDEAEPVPTEEELAEAAATAAAAMRTAACYAIDAEDLQLLLSILGLHGQVGPPPCRECGDPITRHANGGYNQSAGDGLCAKCFKAAGKPDRRAAPTPPKARAAVEVCPECDRPIGKRSEGGEIPYGGRGMCTTCYQRIRRQENAGRVYEVDECEDCGRARANGQPCPFCRKLVDAKPVVAHLKSLKVLRMTDTEIAAASGIPRGTVSGMLYSGRRRVGHRSAARIMAVRPQGRTVADVELLTEMSTPLGIFAPGQVVEARWTEGGWRLSLLPERDDHTVVAAFTDVAVQRWAEVS